MAKARAKKTANIAPINKDNVVRLVPGYISADTVAELKDLLHEAEIGRIVGIAYVTVKPRLNYEYGVVGAAMRYPEFILGILSRLKSKLIRYIDEGD